MINILLHVPMLVFSVIVHEVAHGWTAWRLGDPTAAERGRLTLNPIPHIDPMGSIIVPLVLSFSGSILLGWAKPVPVNPSRLRNPRNDQAKVAAAGPASNLLLATWWALVLGIVLGFGGMPAQPAEASSPDVYSIVLELLQMGVMINVVLAVFNLLPLPPLDGSWILLRFLPLAAARRYLKIQRYGLLPVVGFLLLARYTGLGDWVGAGMMAAARPFFELAFGLATAIH